MHQTELIGGGGDSLLVSLSLSLYVRPHAPSKIATALRIKAVCVVRLFVACLPLVGCAGRVMCPRNGFFRSTSTTASRLAEKPGQDTQLITVDEKLVRSPPRSTGHTNWGLSDVLLITSLESGVKKLP